MTDQLTGSSSPLTRARRVAARRLTAAWAAPVFHLTVQVDTSALTAAKQSVPGATVTDVLICAVTRALRAHPDLNAHYGDETVTTFSQVNLGIAVATSKGLVVPVLHGVESLDLPAVSQARKRIVDRAREGQLRLADMRGGTFTVSNLGMAGIDRFDAILNPPEVAILAVGRTSHQKLYNDGDPVWRPVADLTLTCDHRAVDGAMGAAFLATLRTAIESWEPAAPLESAS